ncbi:MAG: DUF1987 domain-containing protein, partial [Bacteroidales bacterium]|nr:DUF1987 domain-containing protein [Bacteroidales bacterium]
MLEPINIAATIDTPAIILDKSTGEMSFSGRSLPEDVLKIYQPVQNWFKEYCQDPNPETEIEFNLDYYNSSTSRIIVKLLIETEKIHNKTSNVHILWFYRANDEVMKNRGLELKSVVNLPFDMVEK